MDQLQIRIQDDLETATTLSTEAEGPDNETRPLLAGQGKDPDLVKLSGPDDPLNPLNLPPWRKWFCVSILGAMTFAATFSSSVFTAAANVTAQEFGVAPETMALATSLFVFGFATGPILMGPASELHGRKTPLFVGYLGFILTQIPVGLAQNVETILIFRFLGGVASSGSPAIVGGYLADFLPPVERGVGVAIFAATTLIGPSVGAIIGGIVVKSSLGWRWTAWLSMIMGVPFGAIGFVVLPETYVPVLLKRKARQLRFKTKNWALHSKLEETPVDIKDFIVRYLSRPFIMLCLEPILLLMTLYISFTFGMVYLLFVVSIAKITFCLPLQPLTFLGLPDQLRPAERFWSGCRSTAIHCYYHWHHHRRYLCCLLYVNDLQAEVRQTRPSGAGGPSSPNDRRCLSACSRFVLVCLDVLSHHEPVASNPCRGAYWGWSTGRSVAVASIPYRHLYHQRQFGDFRHRDSAFFDWGCLSSVRNPYVSTVWGMLSLSLLMGVIEIR